jgi:hypothetical protein
MTRVGFELTVPVFEKAKIVLASDSAASAIGGPHTYFLILPSHLRLSFQHCDIIQAYVVILEETQN